MTIIKHKIISGFPCNDNMMYTVMLDDGKSFTTNSKDFFDKAMERGYIELPHMNKEEN